MPKLSQLYMSKDSRHLSLREGIYKLTVYHDHKVRKVESYKNKAKIV